MNNYGKMKDSLRRVAAYQDAEIHHVPGCGENMYRVTIYDTAYTKYGEKFRRSAQDTVEITHDGHLNAVINRLLSKIHA